MFSNSARVEANGAFRLEGVRPGQISLSVRSRTQRGLSVVRVEQNGVALTGPIPVEAGGSVEGVHLVAGMRRGSIRGRVELVNGELPAGATLMGAIVDAETNTGGGRVQIDSRGQFLVDDIPPGSYRVGVFVMSAPPPTILHSGTELVTVENGQTAEVVVTVDLSKPMGEGSRP
jgi:hypothetical protein